MIVADEDATLELQVKTVKVCLTRAAFTTAMGTDVTQYFTSIEQTATRAAPLDRPSDLRLKTAFTFPLTPRKRQQTLCSDEELGDLTPDSMSQRIASALHSP
jgi:hypothetical protein